MEEKSSGDNIIAKVGNKFLYAEDVLYEKSMGDSTTIFNQQVNNWIKKQLIIQNAFQNLEIKKILIKKLRVIKMI